ncbi:MAG: sugar transferase [Oscillospiraceae bacterium]|nr:sugar transferase [Oscillospiraceae bacterium]
MVSKEKFSWMKHIDFILVDLLSIVLAFIIAYWLKFRQLDFASSNAWVFFLLMISMLNVMISLLINPYSGILRRAYYGEAYSVIQHTLISAAIVTAVMFLFKIGATYSRELVLTMYVLYFVLSFAFRCLWKWVVLKMMGKMRAAKLPVFIIGEKAEICKTVANVLTGDFQTYEVKGIFLADDDESTEVMDIPVIKDDYVGFVLSNDIQELLVATSPNRIPAEVYRRLVDNGVSVNIVIENAIGFQTEKQLISDMGVYKTLSVGDFSFSSRQELYLIFKRLADVLFGLIGVVVLIPVSMLVKIMYLLSGDRAPIFYRQKRVGKNGRPIRIYKYRSMVPNAGEILKELLKDEKYREEWQKNQKLENDPRITKVGRFLRKTSLDELPQLINVLIGEMSLVGPRPLVEGELEDHEGLKLYQKVKPGITGWWGCNGRSNIEYRERLELEYYYVKHVSPYIDILCLFRTVLAVLKRDGAQ